MSDSPSPRPAVVSYGRVIAAMLAVLLSLLVLVDFVLVRQLRQEYLHDAEQRTLQQLNATSTSLVEPLLRYQLAEAAQLLQQLFDNYEEIVFLEAVTPSGHALKSLRRPGAAATSFQLTRQQQVVFNGEHFLTLTLTRDFSATSAMLAQTRNRLLAVSLLVTAVIGLMLWQVFRRFALQPLEGEIARREQAEIRISEANASLEERIKARTLELEERNAQLSDEIRQRTDVERTLATEKERLAVTLRSIGDGVITTDLEARVLFLNHAAELLTGWTQEEAAGRPIASVFTIVDEKSGQPAESPVQRVLREGRIVELANHTTLVARDGRERAINDSGAPIRDHDDRIVGVVLVFRDVSEKARLEREIQKMRTLESVGLLAGGIAHDFNNLLVGILGNVSLALEFVKPESNVHPLLLGAEKASLRAAALTQQLLTFSKGGALLREAGSIGEIIRESTSFVLRGTSVACVFDIPEDLWLVDVDRGQMSQVVQNIVINAREAMPGGGSIRIGCENVTGVVPPAAGSAAPGRYVKISIQDSGIGIPGRYLDRVFDPYFSTKSEGSGLGLAICHSIVGKHDGWITVQSQPGSGTTFVIHLPASVKGAPRTQAAEGGILAARPATILLMDDEEAVLQVAAAMLSRLGHRVVTARDGAAAVALFEERRNTPAPVDLAIMDLTIPGGMGGAEAIAKILAVDPEAKVLVSSGYSHDPVMADPRRYGFRASVAKPYRLTELRDAVNAVLA